VARAHGRRYDLIAKAGELEAELADRLKHQTATASALPVVGGWVAALPRPEEARASDDPGRFTAASAPLRARSWANT